MYMCILYFLKCYIFKEKEKEVGLCPMTKSFTPMGNSKNFYYTTIADRLRTVSLSTDSGQTIVVKPVKGIPTFPLITTVLNEDFVITHKNYE